jgi:AcrR family transcriptional regulator
MVEPVKRRRYDNARRQAMTLATKAEVVVAARRLFVEHGYPATTVAEIAEAAQTPVATVYRLFESKRGILKEVLDVTLAGDDQQIEFQHRPEVKQAFAAGDPGSILDAFAHIVRGVLHRSAALQNVLASSAAVDAEAAQMLQVTRKQRHIGQSRIVRALASEGALRHTLDPAQAADIVYTLMSPEVFRILTVELGWSEDKFERWLGSTLRSQLLG